MSKSTANFLMVLVALIWGTTFIAQTTGMNTLGPLSFTGARYLIGMVVMAPLAIWESRRISLFQEAKTNKKLWQGAVLLGILMFFGIALQQTALLHTKVANAAFLTALYVPAVPLMSWLLTRQPIGLPIWVAVLLSLAGSYLLSGNASFDAQFADILVAIGALFWAAHIIAIGFVTRMIEAPLQLAFVQNLVCATLASSSAMMFEATQLADFLPVWQELFYAGAISVGIAYTLQLVAQRHANTTAAAFILSLEAVFAVIAGWFFLSQTLSLFAVLGCLFIFIAVLLADVVPASWFSKKQIET
ncbi:MAG: DMT family transporter [Candidatus Puniceispirillaceae bacterium]